MPKQKIRTVFWSNQSLKTVLIFVTIYLKKKSGGKRMNAVIFDLDGLSVLPISIILKHGSSWQIRSVYILMKK